MVPQFNEFERLFLLEFFVDYVNIQNASFKYIDSTMCVSFQFLRYPVMRVCEADFIPWPKKGKDTKIIFKSGKSCLFSVHSDQTRTIPSEFNLKMVVCQRMKCNDERQHLGEAVVNLGHSFINLLQPPPNMSMPATGIRHDLFPLKDPAGKVVGSLAAFARISCFGKLIVTQFQLAQEQDINYMFKGTETDKLFKEGDMDYPNIDYEDEQEEDQVIPKDTPYKDIFGYPKESEEEFKDGDMSEEESEGEYENEYPCQLTGDTAEPCDTIAKDKPPADDEIYKEMGAVVNGHTIIIRVLKKRKKDKKVTDEKIKEIAYSSRVSPKTSSFPFASQLDVRDCHFPLPCERCPPPSCCMPSPPCCMSPPTPPPRSCCCASSPNNIQGKSCKNNISCPKSDCANLRKRANGLSMELTKPISLEPGTVAMRGDDVFFQSSSKAGEPLNDKERKLTDSLYFKPKCKGS